MNGTTFPGYSEQGGRSTSWDGNSNRGGQQEGQGSKKPWNGERRQWGGGQGGNRNFQRQPETDMTLYKPYAIAANREAPPEIIKKFSDYAKRLEGLGYTVRVGGDSQGVDQEVENAVIEKKELILPWKNFANKESKFTYTTDRAKAVAAQFHPTFEAMKDVVKLFLARNARLIMGDKMVSPALFLICWSEDGIETHRQRSSRSGNIGHSVAIASAAGIQVFNLGNPSAEQRLNMYLEERRGD